MTQNHLEIVCVVNRVKIEREFCVNEGKWARN